jgi:short-subunit dehydrogenase
MSAHEKSRPVALVTGGSAGFGKELASAALAAGFRVVITGRTRTHVDAVARELGAECHGYAADATDPQAMLELARWLDTTLGRLDLLINNVGMSDRGRAAELPWSRVEALMLANVGASLITTQACLPLLQRSRGVIVNIGSLASRVGARFLGGYPLAKHALAGWTQQLRLELADQGIHVMLACPGPLRRTDANHRYQDQVATSGLPASATRPGGGTSFGSLEPASAARRIVRDAQRRRPELILPGWLRPLVALGHLWPPLGDWIVRRLTSDRSGAAR